MVDILTTANPIVQAIVGGGAYGLTFYLRNRWDEEDVTQFDSVKFGTTIGLSAVLGAILLVLGIQPTFEHTVFVITAFAGSVALLEAGIKALIRGDRHLAHGHFEQAGETALGTLLGLGMDEEQVRKRIERGAREAGEQSPEEQREAWDGAFPDELTYQQVDDDAGDHDEERSDDERERGHEHDPELSPA